MRVLSLTTDFGVADAYVGIMKGVILSICSEVQLVDLCHTLPPQDIQRGACLLWSAVEAFPAGTIHLAVVDPGVGGARRAVALEAGGHYFVGPDNGLMLPAARRLLELPERSSSVVSGLRGVVLDRPEFFRKEISSTFHGRDIFAPVAGYLAKDTPLESLGSPLRDPVALPLFDAVFQEDACLGRVLFADHFGNLVTNIPAQQLLQHAPLASWSVRIGPILLPQISNTFCDVKPGEAVAYVGSFGLIEIAIRNGSVAATWNLSAGASLRLTPSSNKRGNC